MAAHKPNKKSHYGTYVNHLRTIVNNEKSIRVLHVLLYPSAAIPALGANSKVGVTEVVFVYFPSTLTSSDEDANMSCMDKMRPAMDRSEALAVYDGWAAEEDVPKPGPQASEGETCEVYVNLVVWVDVEAHVHCQRSEDFQPNVHYLMAMKDVRHNELNRVELHAA